MAQAMRKPAASSRAAKVRWLLTHPKVWEGFPCEGRDVKEVFEAMQAAGLYRAGTTWVDSDVTGHVSRARRLRRLRAYAKATGREYAKRN